MKLNLTPALLYITVLLACISRITFAEEFPTELRSVAKCLTDDLYPNGDEAQKEHNLQEARIEMQTQKFDLAKVKSGNAEIQHLATETLAAITETLKRLETIDGMPKPNGWNTFWGGFVDGFLLGSGLPPTGASMDAYQSESAKQEAIDSEVKGLVKAIKKAEIAQRLLPRVAKPYAAKETPSKNGEHIKLEFHEYPCFDDILILQNSGDDLQDCVLEVKITGEKGDTGTSIFFIEEFEKGKELCCILSPGTKFNDEIIRRQTATHVKKAELTLLSPKYSTSIKYDYGQKERDDDYAAVFKNVKLTARYSEASAGIFDNWCRSATINMQGFSRLPPCTLAVTFDGEGKTYTSSDSGWSEGNGWTISGNNRMSDKCKSITAEVSFPRTNFKIKETWNVE